MLLKKPGQFAVGSATQSGAGLLDLNFLNSDATLSNTITHSRAGNATMVASDGLIKWAPHNLLTYSEQFDNAAWTSSTSQTVDANSTASPDGSQTADKITGNGVSFAFRTDTSPAFPVATCTVSFYLKDVDTRYVQIGSFSNQWTGQQGAVFDLQSEEVASTSGATASIESVGNGWYLCSITGTGASGDFVFIKGVDSGTFTANSTGTSSVVSFYIWGAHLYRSDLGGMADVPAGERSFPSASTYVPTTTAARYLPRVGHHVYNGSAWVNEGVLAESEARTNLVTYSSEFDNAAWTLGANGTLTADYATAPDGTNTADRLQLPAVGSTFISTLVSYVSGQEYTISVWVKATSGTSQFSYFESSSGAATVLVTQTATSDWQRFSFTFTASGTGTDTLGISNFDDSFASDILIWGAQFEAAPTPSSYIPTAGSTVTRAAETFTIPAANLPYNSLAMSIQMNGRLTYADEGSAGQVTYAQWEDDTNNRITLSLDTDSTATGEVNFTQVEGGTADTVASSATEYTPGILVPFNVASRHGMTFVNGAVDGVALTEDTTPTNLPDLSATDLDLAYDYMGTVERFRVWGLDLGDGGIEDATTGEPASYLIWDQANDDYVQRIFQ